MKEIIRTFSARVRNLSQYSKGITIPNEECEIMNLNDNDVVDVTIKLAPHHVRKCKNEWDYNRYKLLW